jgi:hypothetical protein
LSTRRRSRKCSECDNKLTSEEIEYPYLGYDDKPICSECECREYHFTCAICQDCDDIKFQHTVLLVFDDDAGVAPGVYRITDRPYFGGSMFSSSIYGSSVSRIGDLPEGLECNYPCGHACRGCIEENSWAEKQVAA